MAHRYVSRYVYVDELVTHFLQPHACEEKRHDQDAYDEVHDPCGNGKLVVWAPVEMRREPGRSPGRAVAEIDLEAVIHARGMAVHPQELPELRVHDADRECGYCQ